MRADDSSLNSVRIVLVEPAGAANVGSVARVMKNMGLKHLVLVNPQCDPLCQEARWMAVHAQDRLEMAQRVSSLPEALVGCKRAIATTARRQRHLAIDPQPPDISLPWLLGCPSALIFGPEDRGLSNQELHYAHRFLSIPTSEDYAALNLAQAVTVCCYELRRSFNLLHHPQRSLAQTTPVSLEIDANDQTTLDQMEAYYEELESLLLKVGFLYPHTAQPRMMKLRRLLSRAQPSDSEIALLRGMIRQTNWKLSQTP
jgi:tRNA/rRNA methyltransferase